MISKLTQEECRKLVAVGLLTDGSVQIKKCRKNVTRISYYNKDLSMHDAFQKFFKKGFNKKIRKPIYVSRAYGSFYELASDGFVIKNLLKLSPTYKTKRDAEKTASIKFLLNERKFVRELAVGFAMSNDGSISISHLKNGNIKLALKFACGHPGLVKEWKKLFESVGMNMVVDKDKQIWSGLHGLVGARNAVKKFYEIGGFFPNTIKVCRGNFIGLPKNQVLHGAIIWLENYNYEFIDDIIRKLKWGRPDLNRGYNVSASLSGI